MLGFGALGQFALGEVDEGVTETVQYGKWKVEFSEPRRFPRGLGPQYHQTQAFQINEFPETVTESRWHQPFSEPQHLKAKAQRPELRTVLHQTSAFVDWNIGADKEATWHQPFSEPKRFPRRTLPGANQFFAFQPTPIIDISWQVPFSEPRRFPRGLAAYEHQSYAAEPEPEDLDFLEWWKPFDEPRRFPKGLRRDLMPSYTTSAQSFTTPYVRGYVFC